MVLGAEVPEDLEALFRRKVDVHLSRLHFVIYGFDHRAQTLYPLDEQPALTAEVTDGVGTGIVQDGRISFKAKPSSL